jgi:hypothetical protein
VGVSTATLSDKLYSSRSRKNNLLQLSCSKETMGLRVMRRPKVRSSANVQLPGTAHAVSFPHSTNPKPLLQPQLLRELHPQQAVLTRLLPCLAP